MTQNTQSEEELAKEIEQLVDGKEYTELHGRFVLFFDFETNQIVEHAGSKIKKESGTSNHYDDRQGTLKMGLSGNDSFESIITKVCRVKMHEHERRAKSILED